MDLTSELKSSKQGLSSYIQKNSIEAYRLFGRDQSLPVSIDVYGKHAVIQIWETIEPSLLPEIEKSIFDITGIASFFYKNRTKNAIELPISPKTEFVLKEYGNSFWINLSDYLDTGLFLDHRETRKWIGAQCKNKRVLNTFAYTGSFSVYAAQGGAKLTHSVDLSRVYCDWTKKNFALNNMSLEKNWVFKMDMREYFKYAKRKNLEFDIIIIDPPTFSRNKNSSFSVQKDHPALIRDALEILAPDGFILFSNNFTEFNLNRNALPPCKAEEKMDTIPPDYEGFTPHNCFVIKK